MVLRNHIGVTALPVLVVLVALGSACSSKDTGPGETPSKPNVVLIVLDAFRADRVGAERNGVPIMPNLARLAKESVSFSNASAPCTWTRPSMASLFTSLYVDTHQVYFSGNPRQLDSKESDALPESLETMASYLKKAGYATTGIQTNANLVVSLGFAQGFDRYEYLVNTADVITARAIKEAGELAEPFFLYAHYMDTHAPYLPPEKYRELFGWPPAIDKAELDTVLDFMGYLMDWDDFKMGLIPQGPKPLSPAAQEAVKTLYDGAARFLDDEVAKLVQYLRTSYPNTYVVILADHGEHLWDHDYLGHGLTMYEEELRVPFLIWGPGLEPRIVAHNVGTLDLLPTLADLLDLEPNPAWQGASLFAETQSPHQTPVYSHTRAPASVYHTDLEMVKLGRLELIRNRVNEAVELYDLERDPEEKHNLAEQQPEAVTGLKALLDAHRERNVRARRESGSKKVQLDPETLRQLESLGYSVSDS